MSENYHDDSEIEYVGKSKEYINIANKIKKLLGATRFDRSVAKIKKKKLLEDLDDDFKIHIKPDLKKMALKFIRVLEDPNLDMEPNYRKLKAYKTNFPDIFNTYGYELSSMMCTDKRLSPNKNRAFFDFPLFFKETCRACGIPNYDIMNIEDVESIVSEVVEIRYQVSPQPRKDRPGILENEKLLYMHALEKNDNERTVIALNNSFNALTKYYGQGKVEDVNNDYGVGYGFDLLCHADYGETLISVKSSNPTGEFRLSKKEYELMKDSEGSSHTDYFIHSYLFDENNNVLGSLMLKYDKENELLVDISDESNVYNIEQRIRVRHDKEVINYVCTPVKVKINNQKNPMKYLFTMD